MLADDTHQHDAHKRGVDQFNIVIDGQETTMELLATGVDIVGFEYPKENEADRAVVDSAIANL